MMKHYIIFINIIVVLFIPFITAFSQEFYLVSKIVSSDENVSDNFGNSVSIAGDYAIVGAKLEDDDVEANSAYKYTSSGSAYIFEKEENNDSWIQVQKIVASDRAAGDQFGNAVAISGNYAVVGAYRQAFDENGENSLDNAGAAYLYTRNADGTWTQIQKLVASDRASNSYFGYSVAISGSFIIIGSYTNNTDENNTNNLSYAGAAYVFEYNSSADTWVEIQKLVASERNSSDFFGYAVAICDQYAVVTANSEDEDESENNTLSSSGSAYVFEYDEVQDSWELKQKLVASDRAADDYFGSAVALDNNNIVIGAYNESTNALGEDTITGSGAAYVFEYDINDGTWNQKQKLVASDRGEDDYFGSSVGVSDGFVVVGAYGEDEDVNNENTLSSAGAAYCFKYNEAGEWEQINKIVSANRYAGDYFGYSVSISDSIIVSGSYSDDYDDSNSIRIKNSGAAYIFKYTVPSATEIKDSKLSSDFIIYPNPATDKLFVIQNINLFNSLYAYFYDLTGQLKKTTLIESGTNSIDLTGLSKGFYIVKIYNSAYKLLIK